MELLGLYLDGGKWHALAEEKLGLVLGRHGSVSSNNFLRLPEVVQEIDTWSVRPSNIDFRPEKCPPVSEIRRILGIETNRERTEERISSLSDPISIDWYGYGQWKFGATDYGIEDSIVVIRVCFPTASIESAPTKD